MKKSKLLACAVSIVSTVSMLNYMPSFIMRGCAENVVYNDFERNYDGWHGTDENVIIEAYENTGINNSRAMAVSGRTSSLEGACSSKGFYIHGGSDYDYEVYVKSGTDETFNLDLLIINEKTGKENVVRLDSAKVNAGE